jgi:5-methylcytosine-specific restriction endonuclease McrA
MSYGKPMQIGEKYGRLTVVEYSHTDRHPRKYFICRCECGGEVITHTNSLRTGNTRSCGCLLKDVAAARRVPDNHSEVTAIILGYKRHAKRRGHAWDLSREEVVRLVGRHCFYCGAPPSNTMVHKNTVVPFPYNGIDRVDNADGYVSGNVVSCCRVCNRAKETMSFAEFNAWARRIGAMATQWSGDLVSRAA